MKERAYELVDGLAREAADLAERAEPEDRKRLRVMAHAARLALRELASEDTEASADPVPDPVPDRVPDPGAVRAADVRAGRFDDRLPELLDVLRQEVRTQAEAVHPGYTGG